MPPIKVTDTEALIDRLWNTAFPEPNSGCWIWMGSIKDNGYGNSHNDDTGATEMAHRKSYRLHKGEIPHGLLVLHKCDVRCCINPDHLFLGTYSDNLNDMVSKGRNVPNNLFGERNPASKLSAEDVSFIRSQPKARGLGKAMRERFGVSRSTIERVLNGQSWNAH